jgi:F-type H+-transporting ATPase subunit delta
MVSNNKVTTAKRYAVALFELSHADNADSMTLEELQVRVAALSSDEVTMRALQSPQVPAAVKEEIMATVSANMTPLGARLLALVFENGRIGDLPLIVDAYRKLVDADQGRVTAEVTTVVALDDAQRERLTLKLKKQFNANEIVLVEKIDPAIIGGVIVQANNVTMDGSIAKKLAQVRQHIVG